MNSIESKKCPYCNIVLDKEPGHKKLCVNCNKYFYVRTNPTDRRRGRSKYGAEKPKSI